MKYCQFHYKADRKKVKDEGGSWTAQKMEAGQRKNCAVGSKEKGLFDA